MLRIEGKHNVALCFAQTLEDLAEEQIRRVCDRPEFADCKLRIMPDVHAGKGCTIGTTMTIRDKIVPGMVGVDIGCGMETVHLAEKEIDFAALDEVIRRSVPSGKHIRGYHHPLNKEIDLDMLRCTPYVDLNRARLSIGTLGGGNHFIEVDVDDEGELYLVVHSGSRYLGRQVAEYYQQAGYEQLAEKQSDILRDLAYVEGALFEDYIHDMRITQVFAALNRKAMVDVLLNELGLQPVEQFTTIHNYIDTEEMVLRKGSVSAKAGEMLLIPINMRDGSLICVGKGNPDWNQSAPHGAGRLMSRSKAKDLLTMDNYRQQMEGIYTTCVNTSTLDESPMAYKPMAEIIQCIAPTADIIKRIRPVYNFKASD